MINYWDASVSAAERAVALEDNEIDALQCATGCDYGEAAGVVAERHSPDATLAWAMAEARKLGLVSLASVGAEAASLDTEER